MLLNLLSFHLLVFKNYLSTSYTKNSTSDQTVFVFNIQTSYSIFCFHNVREHMSDNLCLYVKEQQFFFDVDVPKKSEIEHWNNVLSLNSLRLKFNDFLYGSHDDITHLDNIAEYNDEWDSTLSPKVLNHRYKWSIQHLRTIQYLRVLFGLDFLKKIKKNFFKKTRNKLNFFFVNLCRFKNLLYLFRFIKNDTQCLRLSLNSFFFLNSHSIINIDVNINNGDIVQIVYTTQLLGFFIEFCKSHIKSRRIQIQSLTKEGPWEIPKQNHQILNKIGSKLKESLGYFMLRNFEVNFLSGIFLKIKNSNFVFFNYFLLSYIRFFNWMTYTWDIRKKKTYILS